MFENEIARITQAHGGRLIYHGNCGGGCRSETNRSNITIPRQSNRWFRFYSFSAYGSRQTEGGRPHTGTTPISYINIRCGSFDYAVNFDLPTHVAKFRQTPPGVRTLSTPQGMPVLQFCADAMWFMFDIEQATNKEQTFLTLYQIIFGSLSRASNYTVTDDREWLDHLRQNNPTNHVAPGIGFIPQVTPVGETPLATPRHRDRARPLGRQNEGTREPRPARAEPLPPPPPPPTTGYNITWKLPRTGTTLVGEFDRQSIIKFNNESRLKGIRDRLYIEKDNLAEAERTLNNLIDKLKKAYEDRDVLRALVFGLNHAFTSPDAEAEEAEALTQIVLTFYENVWLDGQKLMALTKDVVITDPGDFKANIGKFFVCIDESGKVKYWRQDGRAAMGGRIGNGPCSHPHQSGTTTCWGNYGTQISQLQTSRDYASLLLLVREHLNSFERDDCYMYLREYVTKLEITDYVDLTLPPPPPPALIESTNVTVRPALIEETDEGPDLPTPQFAINSGIVEVPDETQMAVILERTRHIPMDDDQRTRLIDTLRFTGTNEETLVESDPQT
jgi:hypothetical protein